MEYLNDVKAQSRTGALHLPLLTSRGGGPGRLTSKTMSISLADKQNGFISFKKKKSHTLHRISYYNNGSDDCWICFRWHLNKCRQV